MAKRMPQITILPPDAHDAPPNSASFVPNLPPDLRFTPVPRRPQRSNGLTPERQRIFIAMLAQCGSVATACKAVGCSTYAIYLLRNSAGADRFAAAWDRAVERGARRVLDVLVDHAIKDAVCGGHRSLFMSNELKQPVCKWIVYPVYHAI